MIREDENLDFHCGWKRVEMLEGYGFMNRKGEVMPWVFWYATEFDEKTGVAQVESLDFGNGCVTRDARVLQIPFDGEFVTQLAGDKAVYKVHLPRGSVYRIYDKSTKQLEDSFSQWNVVKTFENGNKLVCIAKNGFMVLNKDGELKYFFKGFKETSQGLLLEYYGNCWLLTKNGDFRQSPKYYLDHQDENGMYFACSECDKEFVLTKNGEIIFQEFIHKIPSRRSYKNEDVLFYSRNVRVYKRKPGQKFYTVALNIDGKLFSLEELGEDLKVASAYKNNNTNTVYLYGSHAGEELTWWNLDKDGNVEKLSDVCDYGYDKYGSIVSKGKTIIFKARDIENASAKSL